MSNTNTTNIDYVSTKLQTSVLLYVVHLKGRARARDTRLRRPVVEAAAERVHLRK